MSGVDEVSAGLRPGDTELARHVIDALTVDARVRCVLVTGVAACDRASGTATRFR